MNILILGAKGMLGQELVREWSAGKHEVLAYDKEELDIADFLAVEKVLEEIKPEVVINAVAINAVDKMEESEELYATALTINAVAPGKLAELCRDRGIILVHYSSDYVFPGTNQDGYAEDAPTAAVNKYGETKARGEALVAEAGGKYYIIRLSKLFGKPAVSEGAKKSFVDTMIYLATEGGRTVFDVVDEEMSSPTYAPDLARLTKSIVVSNQPYGIYHGTNSGASTWYGWAQEIFRRKGIKVTVNPVAGAAYPRPAKRPDYSQLINTKLPAQRGWAAALKDYLA